MGEKHELRELNTEPSSHEDLTKEEWESTAASTQEPKIKMSVKI
ncbi:MAG: hypothetical protein AAF208_13705 [Cyanobacteria bacterium P01_A01_bin.45]